MSIKKIAEMAGTSPATVSRVLNQPDYRCSVEGLREKILNAAMELEYVPNEAARNLKMGTGVQKETIFYLHVLLTRTDANGPDPFYSEIFKVIESEIHRNHCVLAKEFFMPFFSDEKKCEKEDIKSLVDDMTKDVKEHLDGLIIIGKCSRRVLQELKKRYKSIVSVNRNTTNYEVDEVNCDGKEIAVKAVDYLYSLGHREIGYVGECQGEAQFEGYLEALRKHDIRVQQNWIYETKQSEMAGINTMEKIALMEKWPTGIYCEHDIIAVGMLKYLAMHKRCRFHPSIIGSDDIEEAQFTTPMLTTIRLPKEDMGRFGLYLLLDRLRGRHTAVTRMSLEVKLMVRGSCEEIQLQEI